MKSLEEAPVNGKKVLVRLGLDVPLTAGADPKVADDSRLRSVLVTLNYLLNRDAKVIIISHVGRPDGKIEKSLSLKPVYLHLSALLKRPIKFAPQLFNAATQAAVDELQGGQVLGLENLRFDVGEANNSRTFAKRLAEYAELYIDEAFSVAHRQSASIAAITEFLPSYAGLEFEKEYHVLNTLLRHPASPFVSVIGGAKITDKLPIIKQLIQKADRVLIGGAIANTFLAADGRDVGASIVEKELFPAALEIIRRGKGGLILPTDYVFSSDKQIYDIGPKTIAEFGQYLSAAKTIFWNGNLGKSEDEKYRRGSDEIAQVVADSGATSIVGGGNTAEIIDRLGLTKEITFVSSGGGAALDLLAGKTLPGIEALR